MLLSSMSAWNNIPGATSATFTPRDSDLDYCLRAVATYNDGYHEYVEAVEPSSPSAIGLYTATDTRFDKTADKSLSSVQYPTAPNVVPKFGSAMTKRFVLENAAVNNPVGKPVTATDGNGPDDALEYTLSGDTDAFGIHPQTGQLTTKMKFNHESKDEYTVTVTATDTHLCHRLHQGGDLRRRRGRKAGRRHATRGSHRVHREQHRCGGDPECG